jgi:hypothetical protein
MSRRNPLRLKNHRTRLLALVNRLQTLVNRHKVPMRQCRPVGLGSRRSFSSSIHNMVNVEGFTRSSTVGTHSRGMVGTQGISRSTSMGTSADITDMDEGITMDMDINNQVSSNSTQWPLTSPTSSHQPRPPLRMC